MFENFDVISTYTRAQALEDGTLIDVTTTAKEAGIRYPVAVTAALWQGYIEPSEYDEKKHMQSIEGRLWDTLYMYRTYARTFGGNEMYYPCLFVVNGRRKTIRIKALVGPGDELEPVITLMLPNED